MGDIWNHLYDYILLVVLCALIELTGQDPLYGRATKQMNLDIIHAPTYVIVSFLDSYIYVVVSNLPVRLAG